MKLSKTVQDIRTNWAIADAKRDEGLTTPDEIMRFDDISYGPYGKDNLLDIYVNKNVTGIQPAIVNVHGGGWVYGCKEVYQFYCMSLALKGFTVVNINYRLAPENRFPAAVEDINMVMHFIDKKGASYHIDKKRIVMVGDSAGGQLVSHYAAILTNPGFAELFDFTVPDVTVRALGLNCGAYDGKTIANSKVDEFFSEYTGIINEKPSDDLLRKLDTMSNITSDFPPSYIMSSETDFLLSEADPMYRHLLKLGVPAVKKIYGSKDCPETGHIFHINCKLDEARKCNDDECDFFRKYVCDIMGKDFS
ncbi:MAG: alpha/beta hydrolase [Oscillospiraceae bacterium]|nr:alpha/beta hydrolase [Oscillospiraceae bacterium]